MAKYISDDKNNELNVVWLKAEDEQSLTEDFKTFAKDEKRMGIDIRDNAGGDKDIQTIVKEVYSYFLDKICMFVFDNAENEEYLYGFLPSSFAHIFQKSNCKQPMVLITSREKDWSLYYKCQVVALDLFSEAEAILFVQTALGLDNGCGNPANAIEFVKELIRLLEYFPLAIKQAVYYIAAQMESDRTYGVKTYLQEWEYNSEELIKRKIKSEHKTTYTTWKTTINIISSDESCGTVAVDVLQKLAFMTPAGIVLGFFQHHPRFALPKIREALSLLLRYSMISSIDNKSMIRSTENESIVRSTNNKSSFNIHRLVQEVSRIDMRVNKIEEQHLRETLKMLLKDVNSHNVTQLQFAWQHVRRYSNLAIQFSKVPYEISILL